MQAFTAELEQLQSHVPREVPISWHGVASEVRLMGSFDNWSRGVDLSAEEINDSVFTTFRATVPLVPVRTLSFCRYRLCLGSVRIGLECQVNAKSCICLQGTYLVKFLVDGEWRLAPDWPSDTSSAGDTNNILSLL